MCACVFFGQVLVLLVYFFDFSVVTFSDAFFIRVIHVTNVSLDLGRHHTPHSASVVTKTTLNLVTFNSGYPGSHIENTLVVGLPDNGTVLSGTFLYRIFRYT